MLQTIVIMEHIKRLSITEIKEIIEANKYEKDNKVYISKDLAIVMEPNESVMAVVKKGVPLRLDEMRIGYIKNGEANVLVNLLPYHISAGDLIFLGKSSILQMERYSSDFSIEGVMISSDFLNVCMHGKLPSTMEQSMNTVMLHLSENEYDTLEKLLGFLMMFLNLCKEKSNIVSDLVAAIVHYFCFLQETNSSEEMSTHSRPKEIFDRFILLVNRSEGRQRNLAYYADKLCLTDRYVGIAVKKASGISAKEWIDRAAVTAIKVMLKHTDYQISQIAYRLGFPNTSFFNKYFKRLTGMTPSEYKEGK